jgi:hypothetical protein
LGVRSDRALLRDCRSGTQGERSCGDPFTNLLPIHDSSVTDIWR